MLTFILNENDKVTKIINDPMEVGPLENVLVKIKKETIGVMGNVGIFINEGAGGVGLDWETLEW